MVKEAKTNTVSHPLFFHYTHYSIALVPAGLCAGVTAFALRPPSDPMSPRARMGERRCHLERPQPPAPGTPPPTYLNLSLFALIFCHILSRNIFRPFTVSKLQALFPPCKGGPGPRLHRPTLCRGKNVYAVLLYLSFYPPGFPDRKLNAFCVFCLVPCAPQKKKSLPLHNHR